MIMKSVWVSRSSEVISSLFLLSASISRRSRSVSASRTFPSTLPDSRAISRNSSVLRLMSAFKFSRLRCKQVVVARAARTVFLNNFIVVGLGNGIDERA